MTRLDTDPTNYTYTITYLPHNIDDGTVVTVSGSSIYAGVSKSFAFSFTGTKDIGSTEYFNDISFGISSEWSSTSDYGKLRLYLPDSDNLDDDPSVIPNNEKLTANYSVYSDDGNFYISDRVVIDISNLKPDKFGKNNYVGVTLEITGVTLNSDYEVANETIDIYSYPTGNSSQTKIGTATMYLSSSGVYVEINIDQLDNPSYNDQYYWREDVNETFNTAAHLLTTSTSGEIAKVFYLIEIENYLS